MTERPAITEEVARFALAPAQIPDEARRLATNHLIDGFARSGSFLQAV